MKKFFKSLVAMILFVCTAVCCVPFCCVPAFAEGSRKNLALNKTYKIKSAACNDFSGPLCEKGGKNMLTDGQFGDINDFYGGKWAHFFRAYGREITVDLESVCAVDEVCMYFIQNREYGIYCPKKVEILLSEDGEKYQSAGIVDQPVKSSDDTKQRVKYSNKTEPFKARYIKIRFDVMVHSFSDEIEIFGYENADNAKKLDPAIPDNEEKELYFDNNEDLGVRDIVCFHNGYNPENPEAVNNRRSIFKPYIGYVDEKGKYVDTMFDAVMFLTSMGRAPSGGSMIKPGGPTTWEDWMYLSDNTFGEGINVCALDEEVGEMKKQLKLDENYKVSVFLTVPCPKMSDIVFGDIDGDGKDDKLQTPDDCFKAYMLFVRESKKRFETKNFKNVKLAGFFWFSEDIEDSYNEYELEFVRRCTKAVHDENMKMVFIPYWQAPGSDYAHDLGMDAVIMQPNLSFMEFAQTDPEKFMDEFTENAKRFHTGIQLEMMDNIEYTDKKYIDYFIQYLYSAYESGMMKGSLHAYYQGAGTGSSFYQCAKSENAKLRWIYDCLYKFVKGTLDLSGTEKTKGKTEITVDQGNVAEGGFSMADDGYNNISVSENALHGYASYLPEEGKYIYKANRKYVGGDSFTLKVTYRSGREENVKINVNVISLSPDASDGPSNGADKNENNGQADDKPENSGKDNVNLSLIIGISAGAAAIAAAAAVLITVLVLKKKNKKNKDDEPKK